MLNKPKILRTVDVEIDLDSVIFAIPSDEDDKTIVAFSENNVIKLNNIDFVDFFNWISEEVEIINIYCHGIWIGDKYFAVDNNCIVNIKFYMNYAHQTLHTNDKESTIVNIDENINIVLGINFDSFRKLIK